MEQTALRSLLQTLISNWEDEVTEFKQAAADYDTDKIGRYFSALSNEANLHGLGRAWLVFGVKNTSRAIVGTEYRKDHERLQSIKQQITSDTEPSITFRDIHELSDPAGRVVMMEIPAAPRGLPIAWKGHYYARAGESLVSLGIDKQDEIRNQTLATDWTAQMVPGATLGHLDPAACARARDNFALKNPHRIEAEAISDWPLEALLARAKLTKDGKLTRAALLLLGKPEAAHLLSPHPAQLTWKLEGPERAYEHFGPPFLLTTTELFRRIRNIQLRLLPQDELLPYEVSKYDQNVVLEALHNCIAHQDYTRNGRVIVTEYLTRLTFENEGAFFEGSPEEYVSGTQTPRRYRNPFLTQAMVELNMIDTMGYGIHRMFNEQRKRYFPLPDYGLSSDSVCLTIHGGVVDPAYTRMLMENSDLALEDVLALDRVQKRLPIPEAAVVRLRRGNLIEGRRPNLRVSASVAKATSQRAQYIKTRPFDDQHYEKLVLEYLRKFGKASRKDFDDLLWDKLSDALDDSQKKYKIGNLISGLRKNGYIRNKGSMTRPEWRLVE